MSGSSYGSMDQAQIPQVVMQVSQEIPETDLNFNAPLLSASNKNNNNTQSVPVTLNPPPDKKVELKKVALRCTFLSVGEIDTVNQHFTSTVFIEGGLFKNNDKKDNQTSTDSLKESKPQRPVSQSNPSAKEHKDDKDDILELCFLNEITDEDPEKWEAKEKSGFAIVRRMKVLGTFSEKLELRYFPFDTQELSVWVSSSFVSEELDFFPYDSIPHKPNLLAKEHCMTLAEWDLWDHVISRKFYSNPEYSATHRTYPIMTFTFHASRRWKFYFWNVILPMFILVTMAGSAFVVPIDDPATRLSIALTLVLTLFAFKFTIAGYVPKIPYNTLLDAYNIMALFFLSIFVLLIVVVPSLGRTLQVGLSVGLCAGWFISNFIYAFIVARYVRNAYQKMTQLDKMHKEGKYLHHTKTEPYRNNVEPEWHKLDLDNDLDNPKRTDTT